MFEKFFLIFLLSLLSGCAAQVEGRYLESEKKDLLKFAQVICLFQHYSNKDIDVSDLRFISGGIVEISELPIVDFQEIAKIVDGYDFKMATKHNIDASLNKCFFLSESKEFESFINK